MTARGTTPPTDVVLAALRDGELSLIGYLPDATNLSFEGRVRCDGLELACVYKPRRGERPLADFPSGTLAPREVAAYVLSVASGWDVVPPTVLRADGPYGPGMAQLWVETDPNVSVIGLVREDAPALRRIALFDAVANNADRKAGHLLPLADGRVQGCDHGICFAVEPKLRTVLWNWAGSALDAAERATLERVRDALADDLGESLGELLAPAEVRATERRVERLLATGRFPEPPAGRPAIPWPPW